ncbi:MAG: glycosyltransferase family 39 protein [Amaricoccus sp.]
MTATDTGPGGGRDLLWPLSFPIYFLLQAIWRRILGGSLGLDEAEIILDGRSLAWGYGPQPPLYAWLQWGFFKVFPDPLLAMAFLKAALLSGTFLAIYALVRTVHPPRTAWLASASMALLPQIAWESQRALTHSVLATTLAAASLLVFWTRVLERRRFADLLLGALLGLGLLAKANFAFVPLALWIAAASMTELRPRLRPAGIAVSVTVAAAIVAAPVLWIARHLDVATASLYKLRQDEGAGVIGSALAGIGSLAAATVGFLVVLAIVVALIRWRCRQPGARPPAPLLDHFLVRLALVGLALALAAVLFSGATNAKDRWLQPVLYVAAPAATLWLLPRVTLAGAKWLGRAVVIAAVAVALVLPVPLATGTPGKPARGNAPVAALVRGLAPLVPPGMRVVADPEWLAGNLLYQRPDWTVARAETAVPGPREALLLVWSDVPDAGAALALELGARAGHPLQLGAVTRLDAPYPWQPKQVLTLYAAPLVPAT